MKNITIPLEKNWQRLFRFGIFLKGGNGVFETIVGSFILFVDKIVFIKLFANITQKELLEDPQDTLVNFLGYSLNNLSENSKLFLAIYIFSHGIINIFLSIQLYRKKIGVYIIAIILLIIFTLYQIYRITYTHSLVLTLITIWDIIFIFLTWHEYNFQSKTKK